MYRITIKTKYNVINLLVEDVNSPEVKEILEQPYVIEFYAEVIKDIVDDISEEDPSLKKILKEDKKWK